MCVFYILTIRGDSEHYSGPTSYNLQTLRVNIFRCHSHFRPYTNARKVTEITIHEFYRMAVDFSNPFEFVRFVVKMAVSIRN